jgi:dienelactone hydrolase
MKIFYAFFSLLFLIASSDTIPQETGDSPVNEYGASAKAFVDFLAKNDFTRAVGYFDSTMKTVLPEEKLAQTWVSLITQTGVFKRQIGARIEKISGYEVVFVTCEFEKVSCDIKVVFNQAKRVAGLFFVPVKAPEEYSPPDYAQPTAFREKEVIIGEGEWALPGTLTVPKEPKTFPAVVLVHGSGPNDRDETIGPNKPFRDLAWGLASRGIAVLRYEKRTCQHAAKFQKIAGAFTVKEETIDDALAAVALLRKTAGVDAGRIFVIGHSLGGMLIPRIGALDADIAGLIVLAGGTRPLEDIVLEQTIYLVSVSPAGNTSEEGEKKIDGVRQLRAAIKKLTQSDLSSSSLIFGAPASYWLDLRGYDPPEAAEKLKQPMLIVQGERDYQSTMIDFERWKAALSTRGDVTFKSYPALNHLFMPGSGKSVPAEYMIPGNVAEPVITDIRAWIKNQHPHPSR